MKERGESDEREGREGNRRDGQTLTSRSPGGGYPEYVEPEDLAVAHTGNDYGVGHLKKFNDGGERESSM